LNQSAIRNPKFSMRALNRKLLRDLWDIKEQALAIAAVIGCGVATFVMSLSTLASLRLTQETYYDRYRFAQVFATLKRAPQTLEARIAEIPGVSRVQTRVVRDVTLDVAGLTEPAVGRLISIPENSRPKLNDVYLRRGRYIEPGHSEEVLASEGFADAHGFQPGDKVTAVINGRLKRLKIVGVALSPEYIYQIRPGDIFPDDKRFGILWMGRKPLEAAFDMDGAFNDVCLTLMPGASEPEVIRRLDRLTAPYGGLGAYGRHDQVSHRFVSDEIEQLRAMALIAPSIFLGVAAFLLNVVLARIISTQREQIAVLKAFGYTHLDVGVHYLKLVLLIVLVGGTLGTAFGAWMGHGLTVMYTRFYRFPVLKFHLGSDVLVMAAAVSAGAAIVGTLAAVRRAILLPPAEAMRPEPPKTYRATILERLGLAALLSQPARMILRHLERQPWKACLSSFGIALAVSVLILGSFSIDALDYIIDVQFNFAQRQDMNIAFVEPRSVRALHEVAHLPGVIDCEGFRAVPVRLRHENRARRQAIMGYSPDARLQRLINDKVETVSLPPQGIVLATKLAELLGVREGDLVRVEVLEGSRPVRDVPVTGLVTEFLGAGAYMSIDALNHLMREGPTISGSFLTADAQSSGKLYDTLKHTPGVASVTVRKAAIRSFQDTMAENMLQMRMFNVMFATIIAFGVVYNSARLALAERSRELASLRVMGFTRGEISSILLGELAVLVLSALPLGMAIGYGFAAMTALAFDTELYRIPLIVEPRTYAFAVTVVLVSAVVSGLVVRRKLDHLDLVAVLKSRE
jgi:putative ABC transport system permease protein